MSVKQRDKYLDRLALGDEIEKAFDVYVKTNFERIKQYEEKINDETISPWHRQMLYELSLVEFRLDIRRALEVLQYVTNSSLRKNEQNLYRYFSEYQKFSNEVVKYIVGNIVRGVFSFNETELLKQADEIYACSCSESSLTDYFLCADTELIPSIDAELKDDGRVTIFVGANRTIEDVMWFVNNSLRHEFEKRNRVNKCEKKLNRNMTSYVRDLLISFLLQNYVRPIQAARYVDKRLSELEKLKKDAKLNILGKPVKSNELSGHDELIFTTTGYDIGKVRARTLNVNEEWFFRAYQEYNEYFKREDVQLEIIKQAQLDLRAALHKDTKIPEQVKFLELSFDECPRPTFHVNCIL